MVGPGVPWLAPCFVSSKNSKMFAGSDAQCIQADVLWSLCDFLISTLPWLFSGHLSVQVTLQKLVHVIHTTFLELGLLLEE